jgi:hypothetical protein
MVCVMQAQLPTCFNVEIHLDHPANASTESSDAADLPVNTVGLFCSSTFSPNTLEPTTQAA